MRLRLYVYLPTRYQPTYYLIPWLRFIPVRAGELHYSGAYLIRLSLAAVYAGQFGQAMQALCAVALLRLCAAFRASAACAAHSLESALHPSFALQCSAPARESEVCHHRCRWLK